MSDGNDPDLVGVFPLKRKLRGIVQYQDLTLGRREPLLRCLKMSSKDVGLIDAVV